jgi:hypothetical protein
MRHRLSKFQTPTAGPLRRAALQLVAVSAFLGTSLAGLPAHAALTNLDALAPGAFTIGLESGFELVAFSGALLNGTRSGSGNLENDPTVGANAVLSLRRQDGGNFWYLGADFGHFGGPNAAAVYLVASLGGVNQYDMTTPVLGPGFGTVGSIQPTVQIDKILFVLGTGAPDGTVEAIDNIQVVNVNAGSVPEPGALSLSLLAIGLAAITVRQGKSRRSRTSTVFGPRFNQRDPEV